MLRNVLFKGVPNFRKNGTNLVFKWGQRQRSYLMILFFYFFAYTFYTKIIRENQIGVALAKKTYHAILRRPAG